MKVFRASITFFKQLVLDVLSQNSVFQLEKLDVICINFMKGTSIRFTLVSDVAFSASCTCSSYILTFWKMSPNCFIYQTLRLFDSLFIFCEISTCQYLLLPSPKSFEQFP